MDTRPAMTDDTTYFICFSSYDNAYTAMLYLNNRRVQNFLMAISFSDAKRPFTKKVLERVDFTKIYMSVALEELQETEAALSLPMHINIKMLDSFKDCISQDLFGFAKLNSAVSG